MPTFQSPRDKERFEAYLKPFEDCLIFTGCTQRGYGVFGIAGKNYRAHRVAWVNYKGPLPEYPEQTINHKCGRRNCVKLDHLELLSIGDNARQGLANYAESTSCPRGHPYSGVNCQGKRICAKCNAAANRRSRARKKLRN